MKIRELQMTNQSNNLTIKRYMLQNFIYPMIVEGE